MESNNGGQSFRDSATSEPNNASPSTSTSGILNSNSATSSASVSGISNSDNAAPSTSAPGNPAPSNIAPSPTPDLARRAAAEIARKKVLAAYAEKARVATMGTPESDQAHLKDAPIQPKINSESWKKYHSAWQDYYQKYYSDYYSRAAREYIEKERLKDARARAEEEEILNENRGFLFNKARQHNQSAQPSSARIIPITEVPSDDVTSAAAANTTVTATASSTSDRPLSAADLNNADLNNAEITDAKSARKAKKAADRAARRASHTWLRRRVREKATDNARRSRRRRKFIPLVAGISVVLAILFLQYNRLIFAPLAAYVSPGDAPASSIEALDPTVTQTISDEARLIIPKINVDVPITFGLQVSDVMDAMNHGVAHYRIAGASAYPGEIGNFIVTGHSAGDVYSSNPYKYIFSGLERLEDGDLIYVNYESVRYTYQVTKKEVIEPTNVAALIVQTDRPILTLVTCTPLGTSRYRLLVTAEQISPDWKEFDPSAAADEATPIVDQAESLPSNEPSFFERIWNWMTGQ